MTTAEIIILIVGAILFTASFFIPDRGGDDSEGALPVSKAMEEKVVKELVEKEIEKYRITLEEATQESIADKKDMMERYMDRLTNEKMMAVNEYSDTVLKQIKKDHEEAVFLYDMIDNKHTQVKNTAAEINQIEKSVKNLKSTVDSEQKTADVVNIEKDTSEPVTLSEAPAEIPQDLSDDSFEPFEAVKVEITDKQKKATKAATRKKPAKKEKEVKVQQPESVVQATSNEVELMFDSDNNGANNNDRILALHKEGKSNMAIAKELGLGIGEVKLVIDLFEGI